MMMGVYKMSSSVNSSGCILSFTTYLANVEIYSSLFKLLNNFFEAVTRAQKLISELFLLQKWRSRGALNGKFFVYNDDTRYDDTWYGVRRYEINLNLFLRYNNGTREFSTP